MDFQKLTIKSQEAVAAAQDIARRRGNPELAPDHLLLALLDQELFTDWQAASAEPSGASTRCRRFRAARSSRTPRLRSPACSTRPTRSARGSRTTTSRPSTCSSRSSPSPRDEILKWIKEIRGSRRVTSQDPEGTYQALSKFGRDLTEAAEAGKLDPVIGRDEEIRRVIQILSPPHEEQPRADRRARRRQDRDRRRARAADRRRRRPRRPEGP